MFARLGRTIACLALCVGTFLLFPPKARASANKETVSISLRWDYRNIPAKMEVYEVDPSKPTPVWSMGSASSLKGLPIGEQIKGSVIRAHPGEDKKLVLVYRNDTDKPIRFFAAPHRLAPPEMSLGFEFACLCMNHIYTAPPHGFWYRVVQFTVAPEFQGDRLEVRHALVRVAANRAQPSMTDPLQ